jgi:hypothetical protein
MLFKKAIRITWGIFAISHYYKLRVIKFILDENQQDLLNKKNYTLRNS